VRWGTGKGPRTEDEEQNQSLGPKIGFLRKASGLHEPRGGNSSSVGSVCTNDCSKEECHGQDLLLCEDIPGLGLFPSERQSLHRVFPKVYKS
jgi:hypothetical protein